MGGAKTAAPMRGQDGSTALISISAASPLAGSRHAAHGRDRRQRAVRFEKALLVGGKAAMDERERRVAAEDHAPFAPQAVVERAGEAFHPDDRRDAKRDAEEKDAQAAEAAAQVANSEAHDRQRAREPRGNAAGAFIPETATGGVSSILPERMRITRSQRAASAASWVTSASVAPRRAGRSNIMSMIARPVASSRLPVGSSAISSEGRGRERAGERHALLLAARELRGIMS